MIEEILTYLAACIALVCMIGGFLALLAAFNGTLFDDGHENNIVMAYCESIDGKYADGVCFKDGKKMKPEEEE